MRNLKKILAMVLALVMAMSLLTVANAADFSDDAKISYKEAVDVMVAIGVIDGMDDGSFDPNGILTREQAAKLICTMLLGDGADKLGTNKSSFTDVAATRWSSPYIEYCVENGIIAGNGDGTFNPTGKLTGHAFAKLLLCALGYDATTENYVGSSWAVNVASAAIQNGINIDDVPLNAELTREQAAQMAFNTLTAVLVDYKGGTNVSTGDTTVVVDAERYTVTNLSGSGYKTGADPDNDGYMQFCEQYFTKLKLDVDTDEDNFGRTANTWVYDNDEVGKYATGDAAFTYTEKMDAKDVESDLKGYTIETSGETPVVNGAAGTPNASDSAADIAALTGNGRLVEIYATGKKVTKVVVINSVLAEVTKVDTKNEKITLATVATGAGYGDSSVTLTTDVGYGVYEEDDMVVVTAYGSNDLKNTDTVSSVYGAVEVTGLATSKNTGKNTITLDGTAYTAAANIDTAKDVAAFNVSAKYDATLYLDQYGYVLSAEEGEAAASDHVFAVLKMYQTLNSDGELVYMAQVADSTGAVKAVQVEDHTGYTTNSIVTWTEDDGVYDLTLANEAASKAESDAPAYQESFSLDAASIAKNAKSVTAKYNNTTGTQAYYFAANVQFIYVNDGKVTVENGVKEVSSKNITCVLGAKDGDDPVISVVFVLDKAPSSTTTSDDLIFVVGGSTGTVSKLDKDGDTVTYKTYDAYLNGEKIEDFYSEDTVSASAFYKYSKDDETGAYDLSDAYDEATGELAVTVETEVTGATSVYLTAGSTYTANNAVVVDTTDNDITSLKDIKDADDEGKTVKVMMIVNEETMVAQYIYVTSVTGA